MQHRIRAADGSGHARIYLVEAPSRDEAEKSIVGSGLTILLDEARPPANGVRIAWGLLIAILFAVPFLALAFRPAVLLAAEAVPAAAVVMLACSPLIVQLKRHDRRVSALGWFFTVWGGLFVVAWASESAMIWTALALCPMAILAWALRRMEAQT